MVVFFLRIIGFFESIVMAIGVLFSTGQMVKIGDYKNQLNEIGIFENSAYESYPQGVIHDVILDHFTESRTDNKTPKCLLIGWDGARADGMAVCKDYDGGVKNLLEKGGKAYSLYTGGEMGQRQATSTDPGWTTMLTGKWAKEEGGHEVADNGMSKALEPKTVFTQILDAGVATKTSFASSWGGHFNTSFKNDIEYCAAQGYSGAKWNKVGNNAAIYHSMLTAVENGDDMIMGILEYCDDAGHGSGFGTQNPAYVVALTYADSNALSLINAVYARPTYAAEDWLILISSDHGGMSKGHGSQFMVCRQIFLISNKDLSGVAGIQ